MKYIITALIYGIPYFLKETQKRGTDRSTLSWEGLTDNATKYDSKEEAKLTISTYELDATIDKIKD